MKKMNFYFFCLYNKLYQDGRGRQVRVNWNMPWNVEDRTNLGISFGTYLWIWIFRLIAIAIFKPQTILLNKYLELFIPFLIGAIYNLYYFYNDRYRDIYLEYRSTPAAVQDPIANKIIIFLFAPTVIIPLLFVINIFLLHIDMDHYFR